MNLNERFRAINLIEAILINEAIDSFSRRKKRTLDEDEKIKIELDWYKYSSNYSRMWLNYLSDEKLNRLLERKTNGKKEAFEDIGKLIFA